MNAEPERAEHIAHVAHAGAQNDLRHSVALHYDKRFVCVYGFRSTAVSRAAGDHIRTIAVRLSAPVRGPRWSARRGSGSALDVRERHDGVAGIHSTRVSPDVFLPRSPP